MYSIAKKLYKRIGLILLLAATLLMLAFTVPSLTQEDDPGPENPTITRINRSVLDQMVGFKNEKTCIQSLGSWVEVASAPIDHVEGVTFVLNNKLYAFGGFYTASSHLTTDRIDVYNPVTNVWETKANPLNPMPISASHLAGVQDGDEVWIVGGFIGNSPGYPTDAVWRYNYVTDTWTEGPALPVPRASGRAVKIDRNLHYFGGLAEDRQTDYADHYVLDLDNPVAWTTAAPFPQARNHLGAVAINGKIYAFGGQFGHDDDNNLEDLAYAHVYDPITDTWDAIADMPTARSHIETSVLVSNDRLMIFGGRNKEIGQWAMGTVVQYNPFTDSWVYLSNMPEGIMAPVVGRVVNALGVPGQYVVVTNGQRVWNGDQRRTWIVPIVSDCPVMPPTVDAGADQLLSESNETTEITLHGTANDSDGTIEMIEWKLADTVVASGLLTPTLTLSAGENRITLQVTDNDGIQASDIVTVRVIPPEIAHLDEASGNK